MGAMETMSRLTQDLTAAMKARETFTVNTLRQAIAAVRTEGKAGKVARELTDAETLQVLAKEIKKRRESAQIYTDAGALERAAVETQEAALLETYLPAQLSPDALAAIVEDVIAATGATTVRDMGRVMKEVTARVGAASDGKTVSALVRARLTT